VDIILTNPPFGGREEDGIESNFPAHFRTKETADLFLALFIRLLKPGGRAAIVLPDGSLFGEGVKTRLKEHLLEECNLHTIVRLPNSVFKPYASIGTNLLFFEKPVLSVAEGGEPTQEIWFYEHRVPDSQKAYSMTRSIRVEPKSRGKWVSMKSRLAITTSTSRTRMKSPTTTAIRQNCWPSWNRTSRKPPVCATSSKPFWLKYCCDEHHLLNCLPDRHQNQQLHIQLN